MTALTIDQQAAARLTGCDATLPDTAPMAADVDIGGDQGIAQLIGPLVHFTRPINFFGFPALSLPVGRTPMPRSRCNSGCCPPPAPPGCG